MSNFRPIFFLEYRETLLIVALATLRREGLEFRDGRAFHVSP